MKILTIVLIVLNSAAAITYFLRRKFSYPMWTYIAIACLCWWSIIIFPIAAAAERTTKDTKIRYAASRKLSLSTILLFVSMVAQFGFARWAANLPTASCGSALLGIAPPAVTSILIAILICTFRRWDKSTANIINAPRQ